MTDPARWSALNESERRLMRIARDCGGGLAQATSVDLVLAALDLTDTDPPEAVIEMPEGWHEYRGGGFSCNAGTPSEELVMTDTYMGCVRYIDPDDRAADLPMAILALALRAAGWRVEGPRD